MTKQLRFSVVLLATIASMNLNAQKKAPAKSAKPIAEKASVKPTKQETMDWIAGKMKEKLKEYRTFISYSNGEFAYNQEAAGGAYKYTINLNKITGSASEYSNDFYVKGSSLVYVQGPHSSPEYTNGLSIGGPNYDNFIEPFDFKNDDALVERLRKAFATLIEYNSSQKEANEKF